MAGPCAGAGFHRTGLSCDCEPRPAGDVDPPCGQARAVGDIERRDLDHDRLGEAAAGSWVRDPGLALPSQAPSSRHTPAPAPLRRPGLDQRLPAGSRIPPLSAGALKGRCMGGRRGHRRRRCRRPSAVSTAPEGPPHPGDPGHRPGASPCTHPRPRPIPCRLPGPAGGGVLRSPGSWLLQQCCVEWLVSPFREAVGRSRMSGDSPGRGPGPGPGRSLSPPTPVARVGAAHPGRGVVARAWEAPERAARPAVARNGRARRSRAACAAASGNAGSRSGLRSWRATKARTVSKPLPHPPPDPSAMLHPHMTGHGPALH